LDGRRGNNGWWKADGGNEGDGSPDEVEDAGEEDEEMGEQNVSEERRWIGQFGLVWWDNWTMKLPRMAVKRPTENLNESKWIDVVAELERVQPWPGTLHVGQQSEHYVLKGMMGRMDDDRRHHIAFGQNHLDLNVLIIDIKLGKFSLKIFGTSLKLFN
jgi:hypothetical protein